MTYGTKMLKNGKMRGYLVFDSGKRISLSHNERADFENKISFWKECARATEKDRIASVSELQAAGVLKTEGQEQQIYYPIGVFKVSKMRAEKKPISESEIPEGKVVSSESNQAKLL